ncbi:MAG: L-threonylcarbamoyladenylate synthase [Crocinitomicaceae bacterium]|jgi:tRNA threonylcarbamoyl adenosine modification protein (Sua5/YciO/YrdC/YwlC family)|nr:L-threonylcarbamoyladenylate synthase [Crocinitomicaceae bacterium]MDP4798080.1 L-threonylcarbamoyladenylate synthase [Crocinitomicaceae bacterium]MDP4865313.1 L-threonylcarbamoyladenylate synthase [Crocinitomicaceae bacterium]MDP5009706.1 L-threonylcarbamoyladenylate synthase [Crocinitomicaceae bacterium]
MYVEINPDNIDKRLVQQAVDILKKGGVIIFPTDTVYSMGCDLFNKKGLNELANLKGLKLNKANFSIICHDLSNLSDYVKQIDRPIFKLLKQSLPGPFTFILTANNIVPKLFDSNKKEIGIRIPDNKILLAIVELLGNPIATTSLHNDEDGIQDYFADPYAIYERYDDTIAMIIDGGNGRLEASTVIDCTSGAPEIVRQGIGIIEL